MHRFRIAIGCIGVIILAGCIASSTGEATSLSPATRIAVLEQEPPYYIDAIAMTLWIADEANADSPGSDVYLIIDFTPVGRDYARKGEVRYLRRQALSRGEKHTFGAFGVPKDFSRESRGTFTIANGFSQNGQDFKVTRAQIVGRRTENGQMTYWRLAKKNFRKGVWLRNDPGHGHSPAVTIDSLENWEQVPNAYPDW